MLSRYFLFPLIIAAGVLLYLMVWHYHPQYAYALIGVAFAITALLLIEDHINLWWTKKHPPKIDPGLKSFMMSYIPFYRGLPIDLREEFERDLELLERRMDFFAKTTEDLSDEIKALCCIYPTIFGFQKSSIDLSKKFKTVVLYLHPFLTPNIPDEVHVSELDTEDGVYIYTIDHLHLGFKSRHFFNIALYEAAQAFLYVSNKTEEFKEVCPKLSDLLKIGDYDSEELKIFCGILPDKTEAILIHHYFTYPELIQRHFPEAFKKLENEFGTYHILSQNPRFI